MRPDLMGTSGDQMNLQPGVTAARPDGPVRGLNRRGIRTFGFYRTDGNFILTFILNEPPLQVIFSKDFPFYHTPVILLDRPLL